MTTLERVPVESVEAHLNRLGSGNHDDNMSVLGCFSNFWKATLPERDFFHLVFLQNREVAAIVPPGEDRRLQAVAQRAIAARRRTLSPNWNLGQVEDKLLAMNPNQWGFSLEALVLRDTSESETEFGDWYIQDGSHRALAYAMAVLRGDTRYRKQLAFYATRRADGPTSSAERAASPAC